MADELSSADESAKKRAKWSHAWNSYEDYKVVHASHIDGLIKEGFVEDDGLSFREVTYRNKIISVQIHGRILCARDVVVQVDKWLDTDRARDNRLFVQGFSYSYHAFVQGTGYSIVRYDCHGERKLTNLHKHTFDPKTGKGIDNEPIKLDELPSLDEIVRAAVERSPVS